MSKILDLSGQRFGRLIVKRPCNPYVSKSGRKRTRWYCDCDCGSMDVVVYTDNLRRGHTLSCGCYAKEKLIQANKKYNKYDVSGHYGIGWTSNTNKEFYFDLEDYNKIKKYCWFEDKNGYIVTDCNRRRIYIHRLIMLDDLNSDTYIDHIGHVKNDNRKFALRECTQSENMSNSSMYKNNTSGETGIWWFSDRNRWVAEIRVNNKKKIIGYFSNIKDAVKARKHAEEKYFGSFSYDNSMEEYKETLNE